MTPSKRLLLAALAVSMAAAMLMASDRWEARGESDWNKGTITIEANPHDELTEDGYPIKTAVPGDSVSLDLFVRNTGPFEQSIDLSAYLPDGWQCVMDSDVTVPPGSVGRIGISVLVPTDREMDPEAAYDIRIEAFSGSSLDRAFIIIVIDVDAEVDHLFLLYPSNTAEGTYKVYPGERTFMDILLRNTGDLTDTYTLTIGEHRSDWDIEFREGAVELTVVLSPPELENVYMTRLEVVVPYQAAPGELLEVQLRCSSNISAVYGTGRPFSVLRLDMVVVYGAEVDLVPDSTFVQMDAGGASSVLIEAWHKGFIDCHYLPSARVLKDGDGSPGWTLDIEVDGDGVLSQGEREMFIVTLRAPSDSDGNFTLVIDAISSEADIRSVNIHISVHPRTLVRLINVHGGPFHANEGIEVTFTVVNDGTVQEDLLIEIGGYPDGYIADIGNARPFSLGPGRSVGLSVQLFPTEKTERSDFDLTIKCHSLGSAEKGQTEATRIVHRIVFMDLPDVKVHSLSVPEGQVQEGSLVHINVSVKNSGSLDVPRLYIVVYEVTFSLSRVEIARNSSSLGPGEELSFTFPWTARPSARSIRVEAVLPAGVEDGVPEDNSISREVYIIPKGQGQDTGESEGGDGMVPAGAAFAAMIGTGALAGMIIFMVNTDLFRYPFFIAAYPLYSKLKPETLLSNKLRRRIYVYVQNNPGEHFRSILVKLNLTNGTLAHHLYTLEKENLIRSEKDGLYRRFYPAGYHIETDKIRLSTIQLAILKCIKEKPGITQKEVSELVSLSNSTVNYNVKALQDKGIISIKRIGKATSLYPAPDINS